MKIGVTINGFYVEAEGTMAQCFDQIASAEEVFTQQIPKEVVGEGGAGNWKFQTRRVQDGKKSMVFRELVQREKPFAKLNISAHQDDDTLYPNRKRDGQIVGTYGWQVWDGKKKEEAEA